jgi:hypothetical protein
VPPADSDGHYVVSRCLSEARRHFGCLPRRRVSAADGWSDLWREPKQCVRHGALVALGVWQSHVPSVGLLVGGFARVPLARGDGYPSTCYGGLVYYHHVVPDVHTYRLVLARLLHIPLMYYRFGQEASSSVGECRAVATSLITWRRRPRCAR